MQRRRSYKSRNAKYVSDQELVQKLAFTFISLIAVIALVFISVRYFGPKIGAMFGLISVNRDDNRPTDTVSPSSPIFSRVPKETNKDRITINGFSEPSSTVKLFVNGPEVESTVTDNEGLFTFANIEINTGNNIIFAKAEDIAGNESERSKVLNILLDKEPPKIEIEEPEDGSTIKNLNKRVLIKGVLNEKATITINEKLSVVKPDLTFELLLGVEEGNVTIKIEATDEAGNTAKEEIMIKYEKKSF